MTKNRLISIAPMMAYSDRHFRMLMRLLSKHALLYTEMVTTAELLRNKRSRALHYNAEEHPLALQLGGSSPQELAQCARMGEEWGYDEINLNVGCPSDRVNSGQFGACLMKQPTLVADCISAMNDAVNIPVTIKTRIGVDDRDDYESLHHFVQVNAQAGCRVFIIHARKAWLQGLSPKENRTVPPLRYETVYRLKKAFPDLSVVINGGIKTTADVKAHLSHVDGVMVGREAYHSPLFIAELDRVLYPHASSDEFSVKNVLLQYLPYVAKQLSNGVKLHRITRHLLGLCHGKPGARQWRRYLTEETRNHQDEIGMLETAINLLS